MKVACVVPSAGKGRRLNSKLDKPFVALNGKPLLYHTLKALEKTDLIDYIVLAVSGDKLERCRRIVKKYKLKKICAIVQGGKRRFDSVKNALREVKDADYVLIHDAARPFIERDLIKKLLNAARVSGGAISAIPASETIKTVNKSSFIKDTPSREYLWRAQTPQVFRKGLIVEAYRKAKAKSATDDSMLLEKLGHKVKIVRGSHRNIKITTPEDLELAKVLLRK